MYSSQQFVCDFGFLDGRLTANRTAVWDRTAASVICLLRPQIFEDIGRYLRAKSEAGNNATYFLQMLSALGPIETARRLVTTDHPSDGFTTLWERDRLDLTVEAHVIQARFHILFTDAERQAANERLTR